MSRFFAPGVESLTPGAVGAPGDGLEGHYKAFLNSVPSGGSCVVIVPALDPLNHMEANCPANATGAVGDQVLVGFDDEKSLWVVTPKTHTTEINGVTVPLTATAWVAPTLLGSWTNLGGVGIATAGYLKDPLGFVHFKGLVVGGANGSVVFTLPVGFRPGAQDQYPVLEGGPNGAAGLVIFTNGNVSAFFTAAPANIGLAIPPFLAEH